MYNGKQTTYANLCVIQYSNRNIAIELKMTKETKWSIDYAHSEISFSVRHLMIAHVKGTFKTFDASIFTRGKDFTTAKIDFWIDASSVNTGNEKRDEHLRSEAFFDSVNYKLITFVSDTIGESESGKPHELWGELTMNIKLDVEFGGIQKDTYGNEKAGFAISAKLNRSDWGIDWNEQIEEGGLLIGNEVEISCELELTNVNFKEPSNEPTHSIIEGSSL